MYWGQEPRPSLAVEDPRVKRRRTMKSDSVPASYRTDRQAAAGRGES